MMTILHQKGKYIWYWNLWCPIKYCLSYAL